MIKELKLKSLFLNAFDLKDYGFMQHLDEEIESVGIMADTVSGNIEFFVKAFFKLRQLKNTICKTFFNMVELKNEMKEGDNIGLHI